MSNENRRAWVRLLKLPRPDHPTERKYTLIPVDLIASVEDDEFNYEPADNAPVAIPKNSLLKKGDCVAVVLKTGRAVVVAETVKEVYQKIIAAADGEPPFKAVEL